MPPPISRCGFSSFVPRLPTPSLTRLYSTRITPVLEANNWHTSIDDLGIEKEYKFKTFKAAWSFMNQVAEKAEEKDHHPEWSNVYNKVRVRWTTHRPRGLTEKDIEMAGVCDDVAKEIKESTGEVAKVEPK